VWGEETLFFKKGFLPPTTFATFALFRGPSAGFFFCQFRARIATATFGPFLFFSTA